MSAMDLCLYVCVIEGEKERGGGRERERARARAKERDSERESERERQREIERERSRPNAWFRVGLRFTCSISHMYRKRGHSTARKHSAPAAPSHGGR